MLAFEVLKRNNRGNKYIGEDVINGRRSALSYRIFRSILFLLQALTYIAASAMYFDNVIRKSYALRTGAALFIAGAALKVVAESSRVIEERVGLFFYGKYREAYMLQRIEAFTYVEYAIVERWIRVETVLSDVFLVVAAALDLTRAILYIPGLHAFTAGKAIYIAGEALELSASLWIIYLIGREEEDDPYNLIFRFRNVRRRPLKVLIRAFFAIAALMYLLGTILYLPDYDHTASDQNRVGGLYEAGAFSYLVSTLLLVLEASIGDRPPRDPNR